MIRNDTQNEQGIARTHAKVLDSLTRSPLPSEQHGVSSGRCAHSELVEGQGLTTGLDNSVLGRLCESQGGDGKFWNLR